MKIGIVSDTHGCLLGWEKALHYLEGCDLLMHAGDILYHGPRNPLPEGYDPGKLADLIKDLALPIFAVRGNCDAEVEEIVLGLPLLSPYFFCYIDGVRILMLHGHGVGDENELFGKGLYYRADIVIFGHTHRPGVQTKSGVVLLNPGSTSLPKEGPATIGLLDTRAREVEVISLQNGERLTGQFLTGVADDRN